MAATFKVTLIKSSKTISTLCPYSTNTLHNQSLYNILIDRIEHTALQSYNNLQSLAENNERFDGFLKGHGFTLITLVKMCLSRLTTRSWVGCQIYNYFKARILF